MAFPSSRRPGETLRFRAEQHDLGSLDDGGIVRGDLRTPSSAAIAAEANS